MYQVLNITSDSSQKRSLILPDGTSIDMLMRFSPMQYGWFFDNITYGNFIANGIRICNSPNMLRQFKNQIPFGLACFSTANREPSQSQDFSSGNSLLFILTAEEVQQYEDFLNG